MLCHLRVFSLRYYKVTAGRHFESELVAQAAEALHNYSLSNFEFRRDVTRGRCVFHASYLKRTYSIGNHGKTCALYGYSPEIYNLPRMTSCVISKLDREYI